MLEQRFRFSVGLPDDERPDPFAPAELRRGIEGDLNVLRGAIERGTCHADLLRHVTDIQDRTSTRLRFLLAQ